MNQVFNLQRFIKYSNKQIISNRKLNVTSIIGTSIAITFIITFFILTKRVWNENVWRGAFYMSFFPGMAIVFSNAFNFFRKKESTIDVLMLPASAFEKFIFEYFVRFILVTISFLLFFYVFANLAVFLAEFINPNKILIPFSYKPILNHIKENDFWYTGFFVYWFVISWLFAGASAIKKFPFFKTVIFVGTVVLLIVGYFYFVDEILHISKSIGYAVEKIIPTEDEALIVLQYFLGFSATTALAYAYFNIKEKEV